MSNIYVIGLTQNLYSLILTHYLSTLPYTSVSLKLEIDVLSKETTTRAWAESEGP